jgi:hypothetical protein
MMMTTVDPFADTIPAPPSWPKYCGCGAAHSADEWQELRLVGRQPDGAGGTIELRDCAACSSTLAIEVP